MAVKRIEKKFNLVESNIEGFKDDIRNYMSKYNFEADVIDLYVKEITEVLYIYKDEIGDEEEVTCRVIKKLGKIDLIISAKGDFNQALYKKTELSSLINGLFTGAFNHDNASVSYIHSFNNNFVIIHSPRIKQNAFWKNPMVISIFLGIVLGLLISLLPKDIVQFVNDDLVHPVLSLVISLVSGIMIPVMFISMISSISSLASLKQLNDLGLSIFKRSVLMTIFITLVALAAAFLCYSNFVVGASDFKPKQIIEMILNVVPTNFVTPFTENNMPQIVILAFGIGAAMLVTGDKTRELGKVVDQLRNVIYVIMEYVLKLVCVIPGLSLMEIILGGNTQIIFTAWKYIVAVLACSIIVLIVKAIKVCVKCKVSIITIIKKSKVPLVKSFVTASLSATLKDRYDVAENEFGIDRDFNQLWMPMAQAVYYPMVSISLILAPCMIADQTGVMISTSILLVMFILSLQLSLASPGTVASWTIILQQLGISVNYVGVLSACRIFTNNIQTVCTVLYTFLEEIEFAYDKDSIDMQKLKS